MLIPTQMVTPQIVQDGIAGVEFLSSSSESCCVLVSAPITRPRDGREAEQDRTASGDELLIAGVV